MIHDSEVVLCCAEDQKQCFHLYRPGEKWREGTLCSVARQQKMNLSPLSRALWLEKHRPVTQLGTIKPVKKHDRAGRETPFECSPINMKIVIWCFPIGPRRLLPSEQLRMTGYPSNYLEAKSKLSNDVKGQLIGNSFSALAVARLLAGLVLRDEDARGCDVTSMLWQCWHEMEERVQHDEQPWKLRFGSRPGLATMVRSLRELVTGPVVPDAVRLIDPKQWLADEQILTYLLARAASHRGGEIRIRDGAPMAVGSACQQSLDPTHWTWKALLFYQWKEPGQHINVLETAAILDVLRKLCRESKYHHKRYVITIDNQTALSALSKGRSSARALQSPVRRIASILVAAGVVLHAGWIRSKWNPADGPSRWAAKKRLVGA